MWTSRLRPARSLIPTYPGLNVAEFEELRAKTDLLSGIAQYGNDRFWSVPADGQRVVTVFTEVIHGDYFGVFGVRPSEGRLFR